MACFASLSANVLAFSAMIFFARFVNPQNSIKPRKSTGGAADAQKGVGQCPNIGSVMKSPCRMPCSGKEDCENHGHGLLCCQALPGSACDAECKAPVFVVNHTNTGGCLDGQNGSRYKVGQMFMKSGKCCRCKQGGNVDCSDTKEECHNGCTINFRVYRHGEHLLTRACRNCSCSNGSIVCKAEAGCPQEGCQYKNKHYKERDIIRRGNGCKSCACQASRWKCVAVSCRAVAHSKGGNTIQHGAYVQLCLYVYLFLQGILLV